MNIPCWLFPNVYNRTITLSRLPHIILIFQPAAHGTDISTGNQPGIPSLPPATPDAGNTGSPSPGDYCQDNFSNTNIFPSYPGMVGAPDRNHNTQLPSAGEVARPGCRSLVGKPSDGTENTFCSNE